MRIDTPTDSTHVTCEVLTVVTVKVNAASIFWVKIEATGSSEILVAKYTASHPRKQQSSLTVDRTHV
jgi:hypothetical protein